MPVNPLQRYRLLHGAMQLGLVRACHDLSEGGLAVALAEMCLAGRLGATVEIGPLREPALTLTAQDLLFSESNGRLLLEVPRKMPPPWKRSSAASPCSRLVSSQQRRP